MKRTLVLVLACVPFAAVSGCGDSVKTERKEVITTPGGTTTTTDTHKVESTGENPPPNTAGEKPKY